MTSHDDHESLLSIKIVEDFFYDEPLLRYRPLPDHSLEQSPCYPIIGIRNHRNYKVPFYYCKLHPNIENVYLESIEHHCKYKEPDKHMAAILRKLNYTNPV